MVISIPVSNLDLHIRYGSHSAISEGVRSEIMAQCFFDGGNGDSGRARVGSDGAGLIWQQHAANGVYRLVGYNMVPGAGMNNLAGPADRVQPVKRHTLPVQPIDHHRPRGAGADPHHADHLQPAGTRSSAADGSGAGSRTL